MPNWLKIVISGMLGGLVYWLLLRITGVNPMGLPWYEGVSASVLLGGVAAFLAVYLLANSATSSGEITHTLAFALVCGIIWSPVINTAKDTVSGVIAARNGSAAKNSAQQLGATVASGSAASLEQQITKTTQSTTDAVKTLLLSPMATLSAK
jgi:hypothetical protein